jgi:hypothetical protein
MAVDFIVAQRRFAASFAQQPIGITVAAEIRMQAALVAGRLDAGVGHEESRTNAVAIEQSAQVGEHLVGGPFHVHGET